MNFFDFLTFFAICTRFTKKSTTFLSIYDEIYFVQLKQVQNHINVVHVCHNKIVRNLMILFVNIFCVNLYLIKFKNFKKKYRLQFSNLRSFFLNLKNSIFLFLIN